MNTSSHETVQQRPVTRWLLVVLVSATVLLSALTPIDRLAETQYNALFQRALITFALARTLNGVISNPGSLALQLDSPIIMQKHTCDTIG